MKRLLNKLGELFVNLTQEEKEILRQSVLIIDNGYSWLGQLNLAMEIIRDSFPKAEISVLTFPERKSNLQKDFPTFNFILPYENLRPKRYQVALQMLKMRRKKSDFIILFSLDITPIIVALVFLKSKVVLYNQWGQWWSLRLRVVNGVFKFGYIKKKARFNLKNILKRIGLFFVLLQLKDKEALKHSVLVIDNGYTSFGDISCTIQRIKESLPKAKISVLTLRQGEELKDNFPDAEIIRAGKCIIKRYRIARHMIRLRKNRYDYVILLNLDITPVVASILFMNSKVLLYNQWQQWWVLKPKSIKDYLITTPQFIFNVIIFVYLLISVSWIFLKRLFNIFKLNNFSIKRT